MTDDPIYKMIHERNNWMESATGTEREDNPYLIISNFPADYGFGSYQGMVMYLKSERKGIDALFISGNGEYAPVNEMDKYNTTNSFSFPYNPNELISIVPDIVRERKIICYNCKSSYAILRRLLASYGDRYEMCNEFVDVKEMAQNLLGSFPDYELDTILLELGCNPDGFETDDIGTLMKIKWVYERLRFFEEMFSF